MQELAAYLQLARRSVDNCLHGRIGMCKQTAMGPDDKGLFVCFIRYSDENNLYMVALEREGECMGDKT